ncbi:MAG: ABC transporter substrate-binding protein [Proteobacteria bacterium]|nr:ABC transporter substrate-binding protein [Pseudomonadota bacterium]
MKKLIMVAVAVSFLMAGFAFPGQSLAKDKIVWGVLEPLSGPFADSGTRYSQAVIFAAEEINAKGGVLGKQIEVIVEDSALKPEVAVRKAKKLILQDKAEFIMAGTGSNVGLAIGQVAEKNNIINVLYGTEASQITGKEFSPNTFRTCMNTDQHSAVIVAYFAKKYPQFKKYYIICQDYSFGKEAAEGFVRKFNEIMPKDAKIVGQIFHPLATKDFGPYISTIMASGAEVLLTANWGTDLRLLFKQGNSMGWKVKGGCYYMEDPSVTAELGEASVGHVTGDTYVSTIDTPENKDFIKRYTTRFKDAPLEGWRYPMSSSARAYTAGQILAAVIQKTGNTKAENIIKTWEGMSFDTLWGKVIMRPCDHQIVTPGTVAEIVPKVDYYPFPNAGPPTVIPAEEITVPPNMTGNPRCK